MDNKAHRISFFLVRLILGLMLTVWLTSLSAQNRDWLAGISLGVGSSGFDTDDGITDELSNLYYPMGGIHIQKKISDRWALHFFPNVGMSGRERRLDMPQNGITRVVSRSAFVNLAIHPKFFLSHKAYISIGPEYGYLLWNNGSTYNEDVLLSRLRETRFFNRHNLLVSSSIGYSAKIGQSRKDAPWQVDAFWFLELRFKQGITNVLSERSFGPDASSRIFSIEFVTGFSLGSQARTKSSRR